MSEAGSVVDASQWWVVATKVHDLSGERVWSDDKVYRLNADQHISSRHPYTCGNDSRHRPLIATPYGWVCADCEYRQKPRGEE